MMYHATCISCQSELLPNAIEKEQLIMMCGKISNPVWSCRGRRKEKEIFASFSLFFVRSIARSLVRHCHVAIIYLAEFISAPCLIISLGVRWNNKLKIIHKRRTACMLMGSSTGDSRFRCTYIKLTEKSISIGNFESGVCLSEHPPERLQHDS